MGWRRHISKTFCFMKNHQYEANWKIEHLLNKTVTAMQNLNDPVKSKDRPVFKSRSISTCFIGIAIWHWCVHLLSGNHPYSFTISLLSFVIYKQQHGLRNVRVYVRPKRERMIIAWVLSFRINSLVLKWYMMLIS